MTNTNEFLWRSTDADEVTAGITRAIWPIQIRPIKSGGEIDVAFRSSSAGRVKFWNGRNSKGLTINHIERPSSLIFHMPTNGGVRMSQGTSAYLGGNGRGIVNHAERTDALISTDGFDDICVAIEMLDLSQRVSELLDTSLGRPLEFNETFDLSSHSAKLLERLATSALDLHGLDDDQAVLSSTKECLSETVLTLIVEGFEHNYSAALRERRTADSKIMPRSVKRAIDYMHAHAHQSISVRDIAKNARVSVRAMQYGFKLFVGMSPLEYLIKLRLDRAIEELASAPDGVAISNIARKWGFSNSSRFAEMCVLRTGQRPKSLRGCRN